MANIDIRRFCAADRDWLVKIHRQTYERDEGFDPTFGILVGEIVDAFLASYDKNCERGWIAWDGETRLGSIFCVRLDEKRAKLRLFQLVPAARGRGLGLQSLALCTEYARSCGYEGMQLWTHKSHEAACAQYLRNGWKIVEERPVVSFGQSLIEQTMTLNLSQPTA